MSEKSVSAKLTIAEPLERSREKSTACEIKEYCSKKKIASSEIPMEKSKEIAIEVTEKHEAQKAKSTKDDKAGKAIPAKAPEKSAVNIKLAEAPEVTKVRETLKKETLKTESTKNVKDDKSAIPTKDPEESHVKNTKPAEASEVTIVYATPKEESPKDIKDTKLKFFADPSELSEVLKPLTVSTKDVEDDKSAIPTKDPEESHVKNTKPAEASEVAIVYKTPKEEPPKDIKDPRLKFFVCDPSELSEVLKALTVSTKDVEDDKSAIPTKDPEESHVKNTKPAEASEVAIVYKTPKEEPPKDIKDTKLKFFADASELSEVLTVSTKDVEDDSLEISLQDSEESNVKDKPAEGKPVKDAKKTNKIPVLRKDLLNPWDIGVRKIWRPMSAPNLNERPLVLAIHLAPSMPIELFEVFAEIIEVITKKPVVLLYESRFGRPVAKDITDIAILPAADDWNDGVLLPVSFVFEHHLNKNNSPHVFVDILVANDRASHVEDIMDLRGYRCAIPNRCDKICATSLLFNCLYTKGENPAFFGNILDGNSQLDVLHMVANKQAEVGVLEAPVIRCQKLAVIGAEFLHILASLGPLPPYRIMINKAQVNTLAKELTTYLLNINQNKEWMDRLSTFGIVGFAENSTDFYNQDEKSIPTSVPYY